MRAEERWLPEFLGLCPKNPQGAQPLDLCGLKGGRYDNGKKRTRLYLWYF